MRRILHSLLVLLVVAGLVAPLAASDTAARTPICCLSRGEHHCLGQMLGGPAGKGFSAAIAKCPYSPLALVAMHGPELAPPVGLLTLAVASQSASVPLEAQSSAVSSAIDSRPERGPPSFSL